VDLTTSKLRIDERQAGDVTVLDLTGEITLDDGDLAYRKKVHALLDAGSRKLLLNLAGVTKVDSAGVGMLVAKLKTVREKGGDIKLLNMTNRSARLFGVMKILLVFESFDDEATAVKSFAVSVL
jgi:anti-sigma B factor antagonist